MQQEERVSSASDELLGEFRLEDNRLLDETPRLQITSSGQEKLENGLLEQTPCLQGEEGGGISGASSKERDGTLPEVSLRLKASGDDGRTASRCCQCLWWNNKTRVYLSHFLSSWGDRMWMFAGGLFLLKITPGLLRLVAIYEGALSLTVIFAGALVGRWVDRTARLKAAQTSLGVQNLMVCVCAALLVTLLIFKDTLEYTWNGWALVLFKAVIVMTSCIAQLGSLGCRLILEKDWIVVICGSDRQQLATMNSVLRTVDLSTAILAPVLVGFIMEIFGLVTGGIVIAAWNICSFFVEYSLLYFLYKLTPDLWVKKAQVEPEKAEATSFWTGLKGKMAGFMQVWKAYMRHGIRDAGLALAFLFLTVLSLDNFSRAFVYDAGVNETILGVLTACASFIGILGSVAFPRLREKVGLNRTGLLGFSSQLAFLTLCLASVFAPGSPFEADSPWKTHEASSPGNWSSDPFLDDGNSTQLFPELEMTSSEESPPLSSEVTTDMTSVTLFLTGIILSRFGLWVADLTINQILQENVEEGQRGALNGVQSSLNRFFTFSRSILIFFLPTMQSFGYLILISFFFVTLAALLFTRYTLRAKLKATENHEVNAD